MVRSEKKIKYEHIIKYDLSTRNSSFINAIVDLVSPYLFSYEITCKIIQFFHSEALQQDPSMIPLFVKIVAILGEHITPYSTAESWGGPEVNKSLF